MSYHHLAIGISLLAVAVLVAAHVTGFDVAVARIYASANGGGGLVTVTNVPSVDSMKINGVASREGARWLQAGRFDSQLWAMALFGLTVVLVGYHGALYMRGVY
jgi:hypothetical protein